MALTVLLVDSKTGSLVDVAGNVREGGRYKKFIKRMLSLDKNPILDYGGNGGDTLIISKGGGRGAAIYLKANTVNIDGDLKVGGKIVTGDIENGEVENGEVGSVDKLRGKENEISVTEVYLDDGSSGDTEKVIQIALSQSIIGKLERIDAALEDIKNMIKRSDLVDISTDLTVNDSDTLEDVKGTLRVLLDRIRSLSEVSNHP